MKATGKSFSSRTSPPDQSGNAMVYVLIVVALFAALSFILSRQTDTSEAGTLSAEKREIHTAQMLQTTMQLKQVIDQMTFIGTAIDALDFTPPGGSTGGIDFEDPPFGNKVFHPSGGGLTMPRLSDEVIARFNDDPEPGWYIGRFNDVEWTPSENDDVIATAHQISQALCAHINRKLTGEPDIPELSAQILNRLLIDAEHSSAIDNIRFTSAHCAECYGRPALCVKEQGRNLWSFYSLVGAD